MSIKKELYCYLRVSTKTQEDEGHSIDNQRFLGKRVSKKLGMKYVEMNEGHYSTTSKSRPKLEEIKQGIRIGKIKHLWYYSRSRWTRDDTEDSLIRLHYFQKYKTKVYEGENGSLRKFDSPQDRLLDGIFTKIQQFDRENRREVSVSGKKHLSITQGHTGVFMGGSINFGFDNVDKKWVENKEESKYVREIFNRYLQGHSLVDIKQYLDSEGVKPRRSKVWNIGTLNTMLRNRVYIGEYKWELKDSYDKSVILETFHITIPKLVTHSLFNRVQKMIDKNTKNKGNNSRQYESLLSDFLECECGENITGMVKNNKSQSFKSYGCRNKEMKYKESNRKVKTCCNKRTMNMDKTDELVVNEIKKVVSDSSILKEKFKEDIMKNKKQSEKELEKLKKDIEKKIVGIDTQSESIIKSLSTIEVNKIVGKIEDERLVEQTIKTLKEELENLDNQKTQHIGEIDELDNQKDWIDWVGKYGKDNLKRFKNPTTDLLEGFVDKIIVSPVMGKNRDNKELQVGHSFKVHFSSPIVDDNIEYIDQKKKSKGYNVINGKRVKKTKTLYPSVGGRPKKKVN
jgi:DNA invertase Pin-like site-specific DNA recombinase